MTVNVSEVKPQLKIDRDRFKVMYKVSLSEGETYNEDGRRRIDPGGVGMQLLTAVIIQTRAFQLRDYGPGGRECVEL